MKNIVKTYGILAASLFALFGSGIVIGHLTAPQPPQAIRPSSIPKSADTWVNTAALGLVSNLNLDQYQQLEVRKQLEPVAAEIFDDQERAVFRMHLRLLELHDVMRDSKTLALDESQVRRLATSRAALKDLIIRSFPRRIPGNPSLVVIEENP